MSKLVVTNSKSFEDKLWEGRKRASNTHPPVTEPPQQVELTVCDLETTPPSPHAGKKARLACFIHCNRAVLLVGVLVVVVAVVIVAVTIVVVAEVVVSAATTTIYSSGTGGVCSRLQVAPDELYSSQSPAYQMQWVCQEQSPSHVEQQLRWTFSLQKQNAMIITLPDLQSRRGEVRQ